MSDGWINGKALSPCTTGVFCPVSGSVIFHAIF